MQLSPKVGALIIALAVIVIGAFGYKYFAGGKSSSGKAPPEAQKFLNPGSGMASHQPMRGPAAGQYPGR